MISFISGAAIAIVISAGTWYGLEAFARSSIERTWHPALQMEGVERQFDLEPTA